MSINEILFEIIQKHATQKEIEWIKNIDKASLKSVQTAFVATPRFIKDSVVNHDKTIKEVNLSGWSLVKLVRVYWLTSLNHSVKDDYIKIINTLFETAENNEAVALVASLSFLDFPEQWILHATNAVRSNIGVVFDAIAFENPYPKQYFSELAWNQMVLKCIFNDKPIQNINGLIERLNKELAYSISNLAHERWAANRTIPAHSWRLVCKYVDAIILEDIKKLFSSPNENDQMAAALVCYNSDFQAAKMELQKNVKWKDNIQKLSWENVI
jgi:hypothetical protein